MVPNGFTPGRIALTQRDVPFAAQRGAHGGDEVIPGGEFEDVPQGPGGQPLLNQSRVVVDSHEDNSRIGVVLAQRPCRGDSVQDGHGDVGDDDVGTKLRGRVKQGLAVRDDGDNLELRFEDGAQLLGNLGVIVRQQDSWAPHGLVTLVGDGTVDRSPGDSEKRT
jgi:hypothetical protein